MVQLLWVSTKVINVDVIIINYFNIRQYTTHVFYNYTVMGIVINFYYSGDQMLLNYDDTWHKLIKEYDEKGYIKKANQFPQERL